MVGSRTISGPGNYLADSSSQLPGNWSSLEVILAQLHGVPLFACTVGIPSKTQRDRHVTFRNSLSVELPPLEYLPLRIPVFLPSLCFSDEWDDHLCLDSPPCTAVRKPSLGRRCWNDTAYLVCFSFRRDRSPGCHPPSVWKWLFSVFFFLGIYNYISSFSYIARRIPGVYVFLFYSKRNRML